MSCSTVVFGFYGATLDAGRGERRWDRWRPTVALCRHEDLLVDRLELLHSAGHEAGATQLAEDIRQVSPETHVVLRDVAIADPWDFEEVFAALHELSRGYAFEPDRERYLVHITTGSHVMQICWFLLTESRHFPASIVQASPPRRRDRATKPGAYRIIDLDLSRYDELARRFADERQESLSFLKGGIDTKNASFNSLVEGIERVALRGLPAISKPQTSALPLVLRTSPARMLMSVDLPAPLGPSSPKMPPCGTSKLTPLSASLAGAPGPGEAYSLTRLSILIAGGVVMPRDLGS